MPAACWKRTRGGSPEKWGQDVPAGRRIALSPWGARPAGTEQDRRFRIQDSRRIKAQEDEEGSSPRCARVSLTIIVRDEEKNLSRCLESVRGIFDEIVVVDTGSVDRTPEIAREYGARVFDFVWVDDFAAARNAALARARGDYAFWLDADDVIEPPEREKLVALAGRASRPPEEDASAAYVVKCACDPGEDGSGGETVVDHIRLFPVRETIRWTYRVHEQILPALRRANVPVRWTDLTVRHTGYSDRALRARKLVRDARILRDELDERPDDPFVLFNLGAIAVERQEWREALALLRRSLAGSAPTDSITRKLYALIARAHQMLGEPARGAGGLRRGAGARPGRRRADLPRGGGPAADGRPGRRPAVLGTDPHPEPARAVRQRRPGDLRPPHPAQPGGAGRRAGRPRRGGAALARGAGRMPRRPRGAGEARGGLLPRRRSR